MSINFWLAAQLGFLAAALIGLIQQARTGRSELVVSAIPITATGKA